MESTTMLRRLISGSVLRVSLLVFNLGISFFMMPFLINALGDRWYGFWTLVGTFIGYYGLLDFGLSSAVDRFVSRSYGQKDFKEINRVISMALFLFSIVGLVVFIVSFLAAVLCPYFIRNNEEAALFKRVIIILGISVSIGFPMRAFSGILSSKARWDLLAFLDMLKLAMRTALVVYFIKIGNGLLSLALITFFVDLIGYIISFFLVRREFPELELRLSRPKREKLKSFYNYSKYTFISQISDILRFRIDYFVIATFLRMDLVTHYFIAMSLVDYFGQFIVSALGMFSPIYSKYEGIGDFESIRKWFFEATKISVILSLFVGSSLIFYGEAFIRRWVGNEYADSYGLLVILCIPASVALMQNPSIGLLYGISKHKYYAITNGCEALLNVILSIILVQYYDLYGVAYGTMIEMLLFKLFVLPFFVCRAIGIGILEYYWRYLFLPACKTIAPLFIYFYIIQKSAIIINYFDIAFFGAIQTCYFVATAFCFILNRNERDYILRSIRAS